MRDMVVGGVRLALILSAALLLSLSLPALAGANHRDRLMRLARINCPNFNKKLYYENLYPALNCAIPLVRQQAKRGSLIWDPLLEEAAFQRNRERFRCRFTANPCGHSASYQPAAAGYYSDRSCDTIAEAYQRLPEKISPRRVLSGLLHHSRFSQPFYKGRWRDYGLELEDHNGRTYLTIFFGRRCADPIDLSQGPGYNPPPIDLVPPKEDSLLNEKNNGTFKYHVVYVWASDQPNRFGLFRDQINAEVLKAQALPIPPGEHQRSIRFDLNAATGTSPETVDITGQQVPFTAAELIADGGYSNLQNFFRPAWEWSRGNLGRHKNLLVFVDAKNPGICGSATVGWSKSRDPLSNWGNNYFQISTVYLSGNSTLFCGLRTIRHEIGHNMGALGRAAPHAFDGAHCNDAYEDEMCYQTWQDSNGVRQKTPRRIEQYASQANHGVFWDFGHDDYWDPVGGQLPWWTTNLSRFLCPDAACTPNGSDMVGF